MESTLIKESVKKAYTEVLEERGSGCCGTDCCSSGDSMAEDYSTLEGYVKEADYALGCGIPTKFADIKEGDTVLDLGSGAGNDVFIAAKIAGDSGKVIGLDMTEAMINKANQNREKLGMENVEFKLGDIEDMPVDNNSVDVVLSNCVMNLVPDKKRAFSEMYRVIRPGGHFTISDIVITGELPDKVRHAAEMYAACVSGAVQKEDYINIIKDCGFTNVSILKEKIIDISDDTMLDLISEDELKDHKRSGTKILSITVSGIK
ncbi:MAG TPA: arsenite methyltransferase [Ignavibacteria bacterium]|nr:arsenite methyltransferase [Ignavibacteria bacterium]HMR39816.1 arsenite methyltransferase [Ignavibacteria bacterium]